MKTYISTLCLSGLLLSACSNPGSQVSGQALSVREYYDSDTARAEAIESCKATSEAALKVNMEKLVCKNAVAAEHAHQFGTKPE